MKVKAGAKITFAILILVVLFAGYKFFEKPIQKAAAASAAAGGATAVASGGLSSLNPFKSTAHDDNVIRVGVVDWGGYAGGQYFNNGFEPTEDSEYFRRYGIKVKFVVNNDYNSSRDAWKADQVDVLWTTVDSFPTETPNIGQFEPKLIFQSDWSRGGDAIVARRGINSVNDLKGLKVAAAYGTPSHTFLLWMLEASNMKVADIQFVQTDSATSAAEMFKTGKVDASVVWSPDDKDCVDKVAGSRILKSTREASRIIADGFYVKNSYLQSHRAQLKSLVEGWLIGASEINSSQVARQKAATIVAQGLNMSPELALNAINNARLTTIGDNKQFFGLEGSKGFTGEEIYNHMADLYTQVNVINGKVPNWRSVSDISIVSAVNLTGSQHLAETAPKFTAPTEALKTAQAFTTKRVTITFPSGSWTLDDNAKYLIQSQFGQIARAFGNSRVRIEGNTDNVGSGTINQTLSLRRATSVASFLSREYGFDGNRFVLVGNGPSKPVADNNSADGRSKNRRTDFELISE